MPAEIIPFPAPVVPILVPLTAPVRHPAGFLAVEHDGRVYSLAALLARLPNEILDELDALVPASAQATWDEVVKRWPRIAQAVAGR